MDRATANQILSMLKGYYPRQYPIDMKVESQKFIVDDLEEVFKEFDNEVVVKAYKQWHLDHAKAPTVAEILPMVRGIQKDLLRQIPDKAWDKPIVYTDYHEDNEGCGYARNSQTGDYDCVWKYWWVEKGRVKEEWLLNLGIILPKGI